MNGKCGEVAAEPGAVLCLRQDFTRIEDVVWIERLFQRPHRFHRLRSKFLGQVFLFTLPDAVFAGTGTVHCLRTLDKTMQKALGALHFVGVVDVA